MKNISKFMMALAVAGGTSLAVSAQTILADFEEGTLKEGTQFVDFWADSPFNKGLCDGVADVIDNPYLDEMNSTSKVLHYIRPYNAGERNGVEIKLDRTFRTGTTKQYVHVFVYKSNNARVMLAGRAKGIDGVIQFEETSVSEIRANAWSDAVFEIKAREYEIDRLVVMADCETAVNRLSGDVDVYIDEIIVSNSAEPRLVSDYCTVKGTLTTGRYLSSIHSVGAELDINKTFIDKPVSVRTKLTGDPIIAGQGGVFTLKFVQKADGDNSAWIADVFADFNGDKEFVSDNEYLGRCEGQVNGDEIRYTQEITIPEDLATGPYKLRVKLTDAGDSEISGGKYSSCSDVQDGAVYDIDLDVIPYSQRPIISITGDGEQSGWGTIRFVDKDGTEIKVNNGSQVSVKAAPSAGHVFKGWYSQVTGTLISAETDYTFVAKCNLALVAKFTEIEWCMPEGVSPAKYYLGKAAITPDGEEAIYFIGSASESVNVSDANYVYKTVLGTNARRNTNIILTVGKADASVTFSDIKAGIWVDWNGDHVFAEDEFIQSYTSVSDNQTFTIAVPETAVAGDTRLRLRLATSASAASDACSAVGEGCVYDFGITVAPNKNEKFALIATPNIEGAGTFTISPAADADGKYAAGTQVEITAVPNSGYTFVQWMKDGVPYGATMTTNNPLPLTLNEDLSLDMKYDYVFPTYCAGTGLTNETHYGISGGTVYVNDAKAFEFNSNNVTNDLTGTCVADVVPGDVIKLILSGGMHTQWSDVYAYVDWNKDGEWANDDTERYPLSVAVKGSGTQLSNTEFTIQVPENIEPGYFGLRLNVGEGKVHNSRETTPCTARNRGTLHTFKVSATIAPEDVEKAPTLSVSKSEGLEVEVTDSQNNRLASGEEITVGETYTVTVGIAEGYKFLGVTLNGQNLEMEGEGNSRTATFIAEERGAKISALARFLAYCQPTVTIDRSDRYMNSVSISGATSGGEAVTFTDNDFSHSSTRAVYEDHTEKEISCTPGDELTVTFQYVGSWMHKYVYVDWGRDFEFDVQMGTVDNDYNWGDLVAFNYYEDAKDVNPRNSKGESGIDVDRNGSGPVPSFIIPEDASGAYRLRVKVDWGSLDACGSTDSGNLIEVNGGVITDYTLMVNNQTGTVNDFSDRIVITAGRQAIYVSGIEQGRVAVYTFDGFCIKDLMLQTDASIPVPKGLYIVKVTSNNQTISQKVSVE